jgi:hypothetical protein
VYFRKPWQSELRVHWAVISWLILRKRELSKSSSCIFISVLRDIAVYYFDMNSEERKLSQGRFGSIIFLFRMVGIPCKAKKIPTIYAIYMITVFISASTTYLGMFVEVYIHRADLRHAMTTMRALIAFTNIMWIFLYCG